MAVTVKWSRKRLRVQQAEDGTDNSQASITWEVDGVANELEAAAAVPSAALGSPHPLSTTMAVANVDAQEPRKGLWEVTANYNAQAAKGSGNGQLLGETRFSCRPRTIEVPFDLDIDGNPIINSAEDALDPPDTREVTVWDYVVSMEQPFFDSDIARPFFNAVNLDPLITPFGTFPALEAQCKGIMPVEDFIVGKKKIRVEYVFEHRKRADFPNVPDNMSPFDTGFPDMGFNAYYQTGGRNGTRKKDKIYSARNGPITTAVRLDGGGAPWENQTYKVGQALEASSSGQGPAGAQVMGLSNVVMLWYKKYARVAFAALHLPTGREAASSG